MSDQSRIGVISGQLGRMKDYLVWVPNGPQAIIAASNSWAARKTFSETNKISITDCAARPIEMQS